MPKKFVVAVAIAACSGSDRVGADTPEAPLRELITATAAGDANGFRHALVSPTRLRKALDCPAGATVLSELAEAVDNIGEAASQLRDVKAKFEIRAIKLVGQTKLAKGDNFRGCTAAEPFEVRSYSVDLEMRAPGEQDSTTDNAEVIQLDGRWFALLNE